MPEGPMTRTETKEERKRTTTTKQNTSNSPYLVPEVTPQILSLDTKPFAIFKKRFNRFFLCSGMKIEVRPFLVAFCRFLFQANLACFNEIHQNVNDLVFRNKVE